jgi:hypothetical protein
MLVSDWLILIGVTLFIVGVTGWVVVETSRHPRERDFARSDRGERPSITEAIMALLPRWRPQRGRPASLRATAAGRRVDAHDLTDHVCRLADGSMGRVAIIRRTDEEWTVVCVPG